MLLHAMGMKTVDPENRIIHTVADAIGPVVLGKLHDPAQAERTRRCIVKGGGTGDVGVSNAGVVDHCGSLGLFMTTRTKSSGRRPVPLASAAFASYGDTLVRRI